MGCFGFGVQGAADSVEIRAVLLTCLTHADENVREEAAVGLGKRGDLRLLPVLRAMLDGPELDVRVAEAGAALLGLPRIRRTGSEGLSRGVEGAVWRYAGYMSNEQLYLAMGVPMLFNIALALLIVPDMNWKFDAKFDGINKRLTTCAICDAWKKCWTRG